MSVALPAQICPRERAIVLGCGLDPVTLDEAVDIISREIAAGRSCQHMAINAAKLVALQRDSVLSDAVGRSELVTADGQAVVWAARLLGQPLRERVTGIDLMEALLARAERDGLSVYILGARREFLAAALSELRRRYPALQVAGAHHGYFAPAEETGIVEEIRVTAPSMLFVALETPAKELFLARHRAHLGVPFIMGVGGAIDVLAGIRKRAPRSLQRFGLEWFYRLIQDPRRLARRYIVGNTVFAWLVLRAFFARQAA